MTTNQNLKPLTLKRNEILYIGECSMLDLAKKYGTPLYVIDEKTLRQICRDYKNAFANYKQINMLYASKALCNKAIAKILSDENFGFDVVSDGELYTLIKSDIDLSKVLFNGNNKTYQEIELAITSDIGRISVDNFHEVDLISEISEKYNKQVNVLLRVTPGIDCHTHKYIRTGQLDSKFGFDLSQLDEIVKRILDTNKNINIKGLHAHVGSQIFETKCFEDEIEVLVKETARLNNKFQLNLNELNLGGGIGVKYTENDTPPSIKDFADLVIKSINNNCQKYGLNLPILYIEPGRSIISTSGVTLYTVGSSKQVPKMTKYVSVDGGMADNPRPSMYEAEYIAELVNEVSDRKIETVTIAGRYCESGDILIKDITLPELKPGDVLCVYNTGAYNYSMASNYNRTRKPAMVLVNNSQSDIIEYRESLDNLVQFDAIPDRLQ